MKLTKADRITLLFLATLLVMSVLATVWPFARQSDAVRENTLRLHIVANSDSEDDQRLKLFVRDEILKTYGEALSAGNSIEDAVYVTERIIDDIELTAQKALSNAGCTDRVRASVEEMYFDTIDYDGEMMPAGIYKALRIVIGEGNGHNWWCVMYPSLCLPAVSKAAEGEDLKRIRELNSEDGLTMKFAVVELWESFKVTFA